MISDADLLAVCIFCEANLEPDDGKAAVARVIRNRIALRYESDGTMTGTVLKYDQFSWAWFAFVSGKYTRISDTVDQAMSIAEYKLKTAPKAALATCAQIGASVMAGTYAGELYDKLTDDAVMYVNLDISKPAWAIPSKQVCVIGRHTFYRA